MQPTSPSAESAPTKKPKRIWVDGCFDLTHYGHFNALRQAKQMGEYLVVGVHSDAEILKNKGPTVLTEEERYAIVASCKWVDQVVKDAPYYTTVAMLDQYQCDYCVHGDDITTTADGTDCYQEVKDQNRYLECKRTTGISTTELVGRMLLMTTDHHSRARSNSVTSQHSIDMTNFSSVNNSKSEKKAKISHFLPTSKRIVQFSSGKEPASGDKVVYVDGAFDLFHLGHIELLKRAKEMGDFLIVGVHDDQIVNEIKGSNFPVMNVHERVLSVLACRYVDEVIIGAPYTVTKDVLEKVYKVDVVVHGKTHVFSDIDGQDPYELPKSLGIYKEVDTPYSHLSTEIIIERILNNRAMYEARNKKKLEKARLEEQMLQQEKQKKQTAGAGKA